MQYQDAANYVLPFGAKEGQSLDLVAASDEGLRYLDSLRGCLEKSRQESGGYLSRNARMTLSALESYLEDEVIAAELRAVIGRSHRF